MSDVKTAKPARLTHAFWVGFFTVIAFLLLIAITMSLRKWDFLGGRTTYYILFSNAKKLVSGAQVQASGVPVGEVVSLEYVDIDNYYHIRVKARINNEVKLYANAVAKVNPATVIGETTINIEPGKGGNPLEASSVIKGQSAPEIEDIALDVSQSISSITAMLNDPKTHEAIQRTLINLASATEKIDATFGMINTEMHPMISDLHKTAQNVNQFLDDARALAKQASGTVNVTENKVRQTADAWTATAQKLSQQTERLANDFQRMSDQISGTVSENRAPLRDTLRQINETATTLRELAGQVRQGQGTLGKLIVDPRPFENLNRSLSQLSRALGGGDEPAFMTGDDGRGARTNPSVAADDADSTAPVFDSPALRPGRHKLKLPKASGQHK